MELENGTLFPAKVEVAGRYADGPLLEMTLGAKNGRPIVFDLKIIPDGEDNAGVTGSMVHEIPVGHIIDQVIENAGPGTLALFRWDQARMAGRPHEFLTPEEAEAARRGAAGSRRGRPVSEKDLRKVGRIVAANDYDFRQQVRTELNVSERTASRYIALAKERGYDKEEES